MKWEEYLKSHENNVEGHNVYVTDIRIASGGNKFIRNVPPTRVTILSNDKLPVGKTVYYSEFHFVPMKGDKLLKKIIAPFDNTGNRSFTGTSLHVFENLDECVHFYNQQVDKACEIYELRIKDLEKQKDRLIKLKMEE